MKKLNLLIVIIFVVAFAHGVSAQKGKPKPSPTPTPSPTPSTLSKVKIRFLGCGEQYNGVMGACDSKVMQDVEGKWYQHGSDGVTAEFFIGGSNDLAVHLDGSSRSLELDFGERRYDGNPTASFVSSSPSQTVKPYFNFLSAYTAKQMCANTDSSVLECEYTGRLNMGSWYAEGTSTKGPSAVSYKLIWNHDPPKVEERPGNYPCKTAWLKVRYIKAVAGGAPEHFIITTLSRTSDEISAADPNVICKAGEILGGLETVTRSSITSAGQFQMPFTAVVEFVQ